MAIPKKDHHVTPGCDPIKYNPMIVRVNFWLSHNLKVLSNYRGLMDDFP